jgi:hypothetical protein
VSLPKIKGNFKGTHSPVFQTETQNKTKSNTPMTEEESVEEMFRSLADKKATATEEAQQLKEQEETASEEVNLSLTKTGSSKVNLAVTKKESILKINPKVANKFESGKTILSGYMEKEGRGMISSWNKR